jgi:hypothetical protein
MTSWVLLCRVAGAMIQGEGGDTAKVLAADIKAGKVSVGSQLIYVLGFIINILLYYQIYPIGFHY